MSTNKLLIHCRMKIDVLGLGESLNRFTNTGNITVGVNDIFKHHPVDYLCIVDLPNKFTKERLHTILLSTPQKFFTQLPEWRQLVTNYQQVKFAHGRGNLTDLNKKELICYSNNSTFVACVIAFKLGAKEIYLYGADFNTHPNFSVNSLNRVEKDFSDLYKALLTFGCTLYVTKESALSSIIPSF